MTRFKLVKHKMRVHVIGYTGTLKPRGGKKSTYKEQCISSHYSMSSAEKAKSKYEASKLKLSNKPEPRTFTHHIREAKAAVWWAVIAALAVEGYIKFIH